VLLANAILFFATSAGTQPAVRVDTHEMVEGGLTPEEEQQVRGALLVRLVDEGYVIAPAGGDASMSLVVRRSTRGWSVEAGGRHAYAYHVNEGPLAVLSLEILQRATMALDAVREDLLATDSAQIAPTVTPQAPSAVAEERSPNIGVATRNATSASTWFVSAATGAGIFARSGGVDPIVHARVDVGSPWRFGGRLQASIDWSSAAPSLSIFEWQVLLGPTWSLPLNPSLTFTTGVLAGILVHQFSYDASDQGARVDWDLGVPAEMSYRLGAATLGAGILAGVTQRSRNHDVTGLSIWHRGSSYLGVSAGLGMVL
jgi:hypothetical protein